MRFKSRKITLFAFQVPIIIIYLCHSNFYYVASTFCVKNCFLNVAFSYYILYLYNNWGNFSTFLKVCACMDLKFNYVGNLQKMFIPPLNRARQFVSNFSILLNCGGCQRLTVLKWSNSIPEALSLNWFVENWSYYCTDIFFK